MIASGAIGEVVNIVHLENVGFWHFAHSFVRGNWRNEATSTFSLLAKSCHDLDLIMYWMGDRKCTKIHSFGGLYHFKQSQAPEGATKTCKDCPAEKDCAYSAKKIYLDRHDGEIKWPRKVVCDIEDDPRGYLAALEEALWKGPYGRCVYQCDNDVCDHQVVNMEFDNGATASVTMNGPTRNIARETKIVGTKGELRMVDDEKKLILYDFNTLQETELKLEEAPKNARTRGHCGADFFLINAFTKAVATGDREHIKTGVVDSLRSHKLVFAAERSRIKGTIESIGI